MASQTPLHTSPFSFSTQSISKRYGFKTLFTGVSIDLQKGERLALAGRNGSGKTTLLKILSGLMHPSEGTTEFMLGGKILDRERYFEHIGFAGPYLMFYDELTGLENINFALAQGIDKTAHARVEKIEAAFEALNLWHARNAPLKTYSSGMIQRLRLIQAFARNPKLLLLDEPTATLDADGKARFERLLNEVSSEAITIIASNDPDEIALCQQKLLITDYYPKSQQSTPNQK